MRVAIITIEMTIAVEVDDSTTLKEATDIVLFECDAISGINTNVLDKMEGRDVTNYSVEDAEWLDI